MVALSIKHRKLSFVQTAKVLEAKYTNSLLQYIFMVFMCVNDIQSGRELPYLFGAVAGGEEGVAVPPAAFECLLCWAGVVVQQVLLQVLHHAKD